MYCPKCGTENNENSKFCNNCGTQFNDNEQKNKFCDNTKDLIYKKNIFSAFILNIIAFALPALMVVFLQISSSTTNTSDLSNGITISSEASVSGLCLFIAMLVGIIIFFLGMIIYFLKKKHIQKVLSLIYLIASILDLTLLIITCALYILSTCGLGIIIYIPGILQVIAGIKFVSATKFYV